MASEKISAMPNASALAGTEQLAGVQAGVNVNITPNQVIAQMIAQPNTWTGTQTFAGVVLGHDAQTAVAGAATSAASNVVVTSEALVAATTYTLTLTDAKVATTSIVQCTVWTSTGAATGVQLKSIINSAGSVAIAVGMAALTGTLKFNISIFN